MDTVYHKYAMLRVGRREKKNGAPSADVVSWPRNVQEFRYKQNTAVGRWV